MIQCSKTAHDASIHVQPCRNETGRKGLDSCVTLEVACDPDRSVTTPGAWTFPNQGEGGSIRQGSKMSGL